MRKTLPENIERCRVLKGPYGSDSSWGAVGMFVMGDSADALRILSSDGRDEHGSPYPHVGGWEHVSVSTGVRCPTWNEMSLVKDLFWDYGDCVLQFHPPRAAYINNHPYCLHLWRPPYHVVLPPLILV